MKLVPGRRPAARIALIALAIFFVLAASSRSRCTPPTVERAAYGEAAGKKVEIFTLKNKAGMTVKLIGYGAAIAEIDVPDRDGKFADVVLGHPDLATYVRGGADLGATVGRFGNRIANAKFALDGTTYTLDANNGPHILHGGRAGFAHQVWSPTEISEPARAGVRFEYISPDGDMGFPGELTARVSYWLAADSNDLQVEYYAKTTKPTVVNLTNHAYFNLSGESAGTILDERLALDAPSFLPVDAGAIPTGELRPVAGTPFDFTKPARIGDRIDAADEQIKFGSGYDHCWILEKKQPGETARAARLEDPSSGRTMELWTDQPAIQFYSGNFLTRRILSPARKPYERRAGLCLEPEHFPDSPNQPKFPSTVLRPGEEYRASYVLKFGTE